jgi:hypothetical protein
VQQVRRGQRGQAAGLAGSEATGSAARSAAASRALASLVPLSPDFSKVRGKLAQDKGQMQFSRPTRARRLVATAAMMDTRPDRHCWARQASTPAR